MNQFTVTFLPDSRSIMIPQGTTLLQAQIRCGLRPEAPCGGQGTCGKCRVFLEDGSEVLACQTPVDRDMTVCVKQGGSAHILAQGRLPDVCPDVSGAYTLAVDIGTTTVVAYLLDGITGKQLAAASCLNPQGQYGADVISRIQYTLDHGPEPLRDCIREALAELTGQAAAAAGISPAEITSAAVAGNTAMHHLWLGIDPRPLTTPPYMPSVFEALEVDARELFPFRGRVRILPNIAGFVGGDTVACITAARFDQLEELTLMIDIGTNGEMVLGSKERRIACSTAAGPAFEGAKISCGMRGTEGAVDHVWLENDKMCYHVIGDGEAKGLCGSGLLDLTAVLLEAGIIEESGYMESGTYRLGDSAVTLTQKDVREVQLAKAAIRAGIELLCAQMAVKVSNVQRVYLAGAFGNYMNPVSACRIGMLPEKLLGRIYPIGNAAGAGAQLCALSSREFARSKALAEHTQFLELASLAQFQDEFVDAMEFPEAEA